MSDTKEDYASEWLKANAWFGSKRGADATATAAVVKQDLINEGFDPESFEFYKELTVRLNKILA